MQVLVDRWSLVQCFTYTQCDPKRPNWNRTRSPASLWPNFLTGSNLDQPFTTIIYHFQCETCLLSPIAPIPHTSISRFSNPSRHHALNSTQRSDKSHAARPLCADTRVHIFQRLGDQVEDAQGNSEAVESHLEWIGMLSYLETMAVEAC